MSEPIAPEHVDNPWATYWSSQEFVHAVEVRTGPNLYNTFTAIRYLKSEGWTNAVTVVGAESLFHPNCDYYFSGNFVLFKDPLLAAMLKMQLT